MKTKNFVLSTLAGTIVYFFLGWLIYGMLFTEIYPMVELSHTMLFVFLGCLFFASFMAYVFTKWAGITLCMTGAKAGGVIGFFWASSMNLFMFSSMELNYQNMLLDIVLTIAMGAITGATIAYVNGKVT